MSGTQLCISSRNGAFLAPNASLLAANGTFLGPNGAFLAPNRTFLIENGPVFFSKAKVRKIVPDFFSGFSGSLP